MDETEVTEVRIVGMPDRSAQQLRNQIIVAAITVGFGAAGAIWTEKMKIRIARKAAEQNDVNKAQAEHENNK